MFGISHTHLRLYIIRPTLVNNFLWSQSAEEILIMTAAHETHAGKWLVQRGGGPAKGIYQMEPRTYDDIRQKVSLNPKLKLAIDISYNPNDVVWNLQLATVMARLQFWRFPKPLPKAHEVYKLAAYYKEFYNTESGKATVENVANNYLTYLNTT